MHKNLLLLYLGLIATTCFSCKKLVDKHVENYVLGIMTEGRWFLQNYMEQGIDNTADFAELEFQFYKDNRLDAINIFTAATEASGTWKEDVSNVSMTINFASPNDRMKRLSHTWKIKDSYTNAVFAETNAPAGLITIRLLKR